MSATTQKQIDTTITTEVKAQDTLAKARLKAAQFLLDFFTSKTSEAKTESHAVRLAIQTVSRPFRPLESLLRTIHSRKQPNTTPPPSPQFQPESAKPMPRQSRKKRRTFTPDHINDDALRQFTLTSGPLLT